MTAATASRERPILFSGPMVRAILDGRKTQTRRIVRGVEGRRYCGNADGLHGFGAGPGDVRIMLCPYGFPGDRLWVRETFAWGALGNCIRKADLTLVSERKDDGFQTWARPGAVGDICTMRSDWRPSIFMPRAASRITLAIEAVRVERLQKITEEDALAEGVDMSERIGISHEGTTPDQARARFARGWNLINGKRGAWESNPWVWVVTFRRTA